MTNKRETQ